MLQQWNQVLEFLAASEQIPEKLGSDERFDLLILAGNSLPILTEAAGEAMASGFADKILLSGGIGHATHYLRENYQKIGFDFPDSLSEAQMNQLYLQEKFGLPEENLILETKSTNSGENAQFSRQVLIDLGLPLPQRILLLNDPLLQRRTKATFQRHWSEAALFNFVPYIPQLLSVDPLQFSLKELEGAWQQRYFVDLALGEIPRLRNDAAGYGPKGKNFIVEVEIPAVIEAAFSLLSQHYSYNYDRKI